MKSENTQVNNGGWDIYIINDDIYIYIYIYGWVQVTLDVTLSNVTLLNIF